MKKQVLLFFFLSAIFFYSSGQTNRQILPGIRAQLNQTVVPSLIGKNLERAVEIIDSLGLVRGNISEIRTSQAAGTVIRQYPAAGLIVTRGTTVNLYVSMVQTSAPDPDATGSQPVLVQAARRLRIPPNLMQIQQVTVPQLVGRVYNTGEITSLLIRAGLRLGTALPVADNGHINQVISQDPAARQQVLPQSLVNITYGIQEQETAPETVVVPVFVGKDIRLAKEQLPNNRLREGRLTEVQSDEPRGIVLEQFPSPGTIVDPYTRVSLQFSSGLQTDDRIPVPQLITHSLSEAAEILISKNLFAGHIREEVSGKPEGEVIDQSPQTGTLVKPGSAVDITCAVKAPDQYIRVPDVSGMPEEKARIVLNDAGLPVEHVFFQKSEHPDGTVISQIPYPDQEVKKGTPSTLFISENNQTPPWIYWGGGIVAALLLGGFWGWKSGKANQQKKRNRKKAPKLKLIIHPDAGRQTIHSGKSAASVQGLELKIIPDPGIQTIKNS